MKQLKTLFIDRDGTLIHEPEDRQVDSLEKLQLMPGVIPALLQLKVAGYHFVIVTNQNGVGRDSFPEADFWLPQKKMIDLFKSQGIEFADVRMCPHFASDNCECRKPKLGLVLDYVTQRSFDPENSYVIGDRDTDVQLAKNMGIKGLRLTHPGSETWTEIVNQIISKPRCAQINRVTTETNITVKVDLDNPGAIQVNTGIGFFDHMLEQLAKHGGFSLTARIQGDLHVDEHHVIEDTAIVLGQALRKALGDKLGIARFGFVLPMDEALAQVAIDVGGRAFCDFKPKFPREQIGGVATELISHFFASFAQSLQAAIHITVNGENTHHMIESIFKATGRALRQAIHKQGIELATTKGLL